MGSPNEGCLKLRLQIGHKESLKLIKKWNENQAKRYLKMT